jgi:hypothetical protein
MKYQDVVNSWNAQADEFNQWTELCSEEMVDYAILLQKAGATIPAPHLDLDDVASGHPAAEDELRDLRIAQKRYEKIRRMSPRQFTALWLVGITSEAHFDDLVDNCII